VPIEERWEAIERCERLFREAWLLGFTAYAAFDSLRATPLVHDGRKLLVYRADLKTTHPLARSRCAGRRVGRCRSPFRAAAA
jgi:hypothetical protein